MNEAGNDSATVSHSENESEGAFRMGEGAEMLYQRPHPNVMDVHHTLVDKRHRGKGLAQVLYAAMVEFARANQRQVIPACPFVEAMFQQHPSDADLL